MAEALPGVQLVAESVVELVVINAKTVSDLMACNIHFRCIYELAVKHYSTVVAVLKGRSR